MSEKLQELISYCQSQTAYKRRKSIEVKIGNLPVGGENPIRIQSMTTIDTMDTMGSVEQTIRMVDAGCEYVRLTAPSLKEAENLRVIKEELSKRGVYVPLIADIHFTPNAAELAARIVEKVRVNPGNYVDKKKFQQIEYTDLQYEAEIERIRDRFSPLVKICKEYGTAMRIGTNHGSLSDRIMSRYGDTPLGMVESALEFLRICESLNYYQVVLSMKASNTRIMVQAYRLLVQKLKSEGLKAYPLHLGVTEAGEADDGRIKSAVGIGALLEDGLGDTVRVSLTEEPEAEAPVAINLVKRYPKRAIHDPIAELGNEYKDPYSYSRRKTVEVTNLGKENVPRVIADLSGLWNPELKDLAAIGHFYLPALDKWGMNDLGADYVYSGSEALPFMLPNGLKEILDHKAWLSSSDKVNKLPLIEAADLKAEAKWHKEINFVRIDANDLQLLDEIEIDKTLVFWLTTSNLHGMAEQRRFFEGLNERGITQPVIIERSYEGLGKEEFLLYPATDIGSLLIDGWGDGAIIKRKITTDDKSEYLTEVKHTNEVCFGILQAARTRMSKTEYISCPSCGRTLFDLQETTAMIRKQTDHLKGVKIGIMGCIVNGPGEMADADYGYVGSGKGKITLYKGQEVVKKSVPSERAVDELIQIIKEDGMWREPVDN